MHAAGCTTYGGLGELGAGDVVNWPRGDPAAAGGGERDGRHHPDPDTDGPLVDVERGLVDVDILGRPGTAGAEPGQRARDRFQVPGEVLAAHALRSGHDRVRAEHLLRRGGEPGRAGRLIDRGWHVPLVVEVRD